MANVPTPRSYNAVLGDLLDAFLSKFGLETMDVGSPILSIMEAAAQSDVRSTADIFTMLNSISLDRATGNGLDQIGADEDIPRLTQTFASGLINVGDSSFAKISTKIYGNLPAPIVGSGTIYVSDATAFFGTPHLGNGIPQACSGSVYIGRGTANFEGPLTFTARTWFTTYWSLTLAGGSETQKFHNHSEAVVLAQGGNRLVPAGSTVQTAQGSVAEAIQFSTLYAATVPDGEVSITGVQVVAKRPGTDGNIPAGAVNAFTSLPFAGATATNLLPYANALPSEDDDAYKERIRNIRQSRAKGTALAIETGVLGVTAADENKSVLSAKVVSRSGFPTTLYVDDGTGYEEQTAGIPIESVVDSATGGEKFFELNNRPVAKAFVEATVDEPYLLADGDKLAVKVDGVIYEHTFSADEFRNIGNATAYEVVASINADATLPYDARLAANGNRLALIADADTNEDLEVVVPEDGNNANTGLGFTAGRVDTLLLYKNDRLLNKDGRTPTITSAGKARWSPSLATGVTLVLDVDGTGAVTYTFTDQDFIDAGTPYATLATSNSLESWVSVFNSRLPGVSAQISGSGIILSSNLGASSRASLSITGGTLVTPGSVFAVSDSLGLANDYSLDRNTGEFRIATALAAGDTLAAGTVSTRAFVQSLSIGSPVISATALQYWVVDGRAQVIATAILAGSALSIAQYVTNPATAWGDRVRITASVGTPFTEVEIKDWAIFYDTALSANNRGAWRVARVDVGGTFFEIERPTGGYTTEAVALDTGGLKFVRTEARLVPVSIAAATYTAASLVDELNADLRGATAEVYKTNKIRVRTNSFDIDSDIALVAQNGDAEALQMSVGNYVPNLVSHLGVAEAGSFEYGTPEFFMGQTFGITSTTIFDDTDPTATVSSGNQLVFKRPFSDADSNGDAQPRERVANNNYHSAIEVVSGTTVTVRQPVLQEFLDLERFYSAAPYAIGPDDEFGVLVDENEQSQRYVIPMWRRITPTTTTYGATNLFTDQDNADESLDVAFGSDFDFRDFAVWMNARTKTHNEAGDTTKTVLFRYVRQGPDGNTARLSYVYPLAAGSAIAVTADDSLDGNTLVHVALPSGSARTGVTVRNSTRIGAMAASGSPFTLTYILGYSISSANRVTKLDYNTQTSNFTVGQVLTGGSSGAMGTISADVDAGATGTLTLTGVTGIFLDTEIITDALTGSATATASQYGVTTLTLDIAGPGATDHGFDTGNVLYVASTNINFNSGLRTITDLSTSTLSYVDDVSTTQAPTASIGTISYDVGEATLAGSTVVSSDLVNVGSGSALDSSFEQTTRITSLGDQWWKTVAPSAGSLGTVPVWADLELAANLSFFPVNTGSSTAAAIATAVNALAAVEDSTVPVTALALGVGGITTGIVSKASYDEFASATKYYQLSDGINWIRSQVNPPTTPDNYTFTFKDAVTSTLATNSGWTSEDIRLVPTTTKNVVDWFNAQGVSGLSSVAEVSAAASGDKPQISTLTPGSTGGIRVQGGTANSVSAPAVGSASVMGMAYSLVTVKKSDATGLHAGQWVRLVNGLPMPKQVFDTGTVVLSLAGTGSTGTLILDASSDSNIWNYANIAATPVSADFNVEKQGRFVAFVWDQISSAPTFAGVNEGDWVEISGTVNSNNTGTFRIVRIREDQLAFWIENDNAVEEVSKTANLLFRTYDSVLPGDELIVNTPIFGTDNVGRWTVTGLDNADLKKVYVDTSAHAFTAYTGPVTLGANSSLVQAFEGAASSLIKKIRAISPNQDNGTYVDVKFESDGGYRQISVEAATLIQPLDKLAFPTDLFLGVDGYRYSTGLIQEVNKVAYGDPSDPSTYPGIIAAGARVNIQSALVKRITCALALRLKSGVSEVDIKNRVRSAVASVINKTGVGQAISISSLITAAGSVNGVVAVTWLAPVFSVGNDLIPVQPFEKPLILNLEDDISVSTVSA